MYAKQYTHTHTHQYWIAEYTHSHWNKHTQPLAHTHYNSSPGTMMSGVSNIACPCRVLSAIPTVFNLSSTWEAEAYKYNIIFSKTLAVALKTHVLQYCLYSSTRTYPSESGKACSIQTWRFGAGCMTYTLYTLFSGRISFRKYGFVSWHFHNCSQKDRWKLIFL